MYKVRVACMIQSPMCGWWCLKAEIVDKTTTLRGLVSYVK